jgi:hypothetical protein
MIFLSTGKMEIKNLFIQNKMPDQISYSAGMFGLMNQLDVSLQHHNSSIIDLHGKPDYFQIKVYLWMSNLNERIHTFPILAAYLKKMKLARP